MELYIHSTGIISGAGSDSRPDFLLQQQEAQDGRLFCVEPDYTPFIPPMQLRRMSKAVRIGIAASKLCMERAGVEKPDALSIGTAMGCLQDTEVFLNKMVEQDEQMLTPTAFIQSTHNTVSGQIALLAGCYGHNLTFVQRGHSFEHALINAQLYLDEHAGEQMLLGGIDELTDNSYKAFSTGGVYTDDVMAGEGAAFFMASANKPSVKTVCIKDIHCFTTADTNVALEEASSFLGRNNVQADVFVSGVSGVADEFYNKLHNEVFADAMQVKFKRLCGEYGTASSFALGMIVHAVQQGAFPEISVVKNSDSPVREIVLVNNIKNYYACWHMQVV